MFIGVWIYDTFHPGELDTLCIWMQSSRPASIGMTVSFELLRFFVTNIYRFQQLFANLIALEK